MVADNAETRALPSANGHHAQAQATMVDIVRRVQHRSVNTARAWTDMALSDGRGLVNDVFDILEAGSKTLHHRLARVMSDAGAFTQIAYTATRWAPPAWRQLAHLRAEFRHLQTSRTIWRNAPPALVYTARYPRWGPAGGGARRGRQRSRSRGATLEGAPPWET